MPLCVRAATCPCTAALASWCLEPAWSSGHLPSISTCSATSGPPSATCVLCACCLQASVAVCVCISLGSFSLARLVSWLSCRAGVRAKRSADRPYAYPLRFGCPYRESCVSVTGQEEEEHRIGRLFEWTWHYLLGEPVKVPPTDGRKLCPKDPYACFSKVTNVQDVIHDLKVTCSEADTSQLCVQEVGPVHP